LRLENVEDNHLIQLGRGLDEIHLKVHVDKLGLCYYIYIEEMSDVEVSAKDVRSRIFERFSSDSPGTQRRPSVQPQKVQFTNPEVTAIATFDPDEVIHVLNPNQL
jgi:hypothetical protein